jgi:hypothetical protein
MKIRHIAAGCAALLGASPAAAGLVTASNPQGIVAAMQAAGYKADLSTDKGGDPKIDSGSSGTRFTVFFYGCTDHKDCTAIQFYAGYNLDTAPSLDVVNAWNQERRFGRAYIDKEGDPVIEMDVDLDDGGMSPALFTDNVEYWAAVMSSFEKHVGFRQ